MRVRVNDSSLFFDVEGPKLVADGGSMRERPTVLLLLAGRRDPITPVAAAEEIVQCLPGPDVTLKIFDESSHFIQLAEPDRFFPVVRDFITS